MRCCASNQSVRDYSSHRGDARELSHGDTGASVIEPGIHQVTLPESERGYTLAIPDGDIKQKATPLIVSLHYEAEVAPFYGRGLLQSLIVPC